MITEQQLRQILSSATTTIEDMAIMTLLDLLNDEMTIDELKQMIKGEK